MRRYFNKLVTFLENFWKKHMMSISITGLVCLFILAYFWESIIITIYPGHAGVLWKRFHDGVVLDRVYDEGLHILWPWDKMYIYDIRVQEHHDTIMFLETNGMEIKADVSVRYYPLHDSLPVLHQRIGPDYKQKLIIPELVSSLRLVLGRQTYHAIYTQSEENFVRAIASNLETELISSHIHVDDVLLTGLSLPVLVESAIQAKLVHEQDMQSYDFRLQTEEQEKQRKKIEADGIAYFEQNSRIPILKWEGIKATKKFADSPNTKIVIIGNDANSLPVILSAEPSKN